jgi:signal transduction histidine kinase
MFSSIATQSAAGHGVSSPRPHARRISLSVATRWVVGGWILLVGGYVAVALLLPAGDTLTAFGDIFQFMVPLLANTGLLLNAVSPRWRQNMFWLLLALGCTFWMTGQYSWVHYEVILHQKTPNPMAADVIFFLHTVPMIAALTLQPHLRRAERPTQFGVLDISLLFLWWLFLYLFVVIPWQYVLPDGRAYGVSFNYLYLLENMVFLVGLLVLCWQARGAWRTIYATLLSAWVLYVSGSTVINFAIDAGTYHTGGLYDVPLVASFAMFGTAGLVAYRRRVPEASLAPAPLRDSVWPARLAMLAVLSLPLFALWSRFLSGAPDAVRGYRMFLTLAAMLPLNGLVFWRQHLVNRERQGLLRTSQASVESLRRLQNQLVQSEKLSSLGQLAAGAAHEINNPLTAILGFTDVLESDRALAPRHRHLVEKVRAQAVRTKSLITSLLSFARQVPAEKVLLDVNQVLASALQLRSLDLRDKNVKIDLDAESLLPGVRGDPNQLLQVLFHIINNAVDALEETGGGALHICTRREGARAVIEFADNGPGIREPHRVFDPFYTTKPVGKGTGLGLSICYGIVQEHGGDIACFNRPEGGATFRIELPVLPVNVPQPVASYLATAKRS